VTPLGSFHNQQRPLTDTDILRFVRKAGLDRVRRAIDRAMTPELPLVAAE
jgi:hypothetical protein